VARLGLGPGRLLRDQQALLREITKGVLSPDGYDRIKEQMNDDAGDQFYASGDLVSMAGGKTYVTTVNFNPQVGDGIVEVDPATGAISRVVDVSDVDDDRRAHDLLDGDGHRYQALAFRIADWSDCW
jgi:hypothetical protein